MILTILSSKSLSLEQLHSVYVIFHVIRADMTKFWNLEQYMYSLDAAISWTWWLPSYCNNSNVEIEFIKAFHCRTWLPNFKRGNKSLVVTFEVQLWEFFWKVPLGLFRFSNNPLSHLITWNKLLYKLVTMYTFDFI